MSKIAFIADVHIGNPTAFGGAVHCGFNVRGRETIKALQDAVDATKDCDELVICGDLFDTDNPSPQMIAEVMGTLLAANSVHILLGNHDMNSDIADDHALAPLRYLPNVTTWEVPGVYRSSDANLIMVPFKAGDCRDWFEAAVLDEQVTADDHVTLMAFHLGVIDGRTPAFLTAAHDAIPLELLQTTMNKAGIDHAFCGNWHNPASWRNIHQVGALCPTGWDNPGWDYGQIAVFDTVKGVRTTRHITGPRFLTAHTSDDVAIAQAEAKRRRCKLYLTLKGEAAKDLDAVREQGTIARAVSDTEGAREATREAAVAVRKASTLDEALAKYVQSMPLAEGLERETVRSMAANYLAKGGA